MIAWHQRIKSAREKQGLSIRGAALLIGIDSASLSRYERHKMEPSFSVGLDINQFYGIGCGRCEGE